MVSRINHTANYVTADGKQCNPTIVTLIGGGNSSHICASLIHENTRGNAVVRVFTSKPHIWSKNPQVKFPNGQIQTGVIDYITDDVKMSLVDSDIVLWTGPVHATRGVFELIRPHVNPKRTAIGTIFAQGLVHILASNIFGPDMKFFALRNIPWLCRTTQPGRECEIIGSKTSIEAVVVNLTLDWVKEQLEPLFVTQKCGKWEPVINLCTDFCPIVFNPANQLIHPARYWGLFRKWVPGTYLSGTEEPNEWLYRDMDELSGNILEALDEELQKIKDAYYKSVGCESCSQILPLRERLILQYNDQIKDDSTLAKIIGTNSAYSMAKTPMIRSDKGVAPNPDHRVVKDDIGWGLCVLVSIAQRLNVACTIMQMLILWHQGLMNKEYLVNGSLTGKDCAELVLLGPKDPLEIVSMPQSMLVVNERLCKVDVESVENRIGNP